jgi:hypothetical protein
MQDVTNPKPDRRTKPATVTTIPVWKRGTLWLYFPADDVAKVKFPQVARLEMRNRYDRILSHDEEGRFELITAHLEPVEIIRIRGNESQVKLRDSFQAWAMLHNWEEHSQMAALRLAYFKGRLTLVEIQDLMAQLDEMDEATYEQYFT